MDNLKLQIHWYSRDGLTAKEAAAELSAVGHGLPELRHINAGSIQVIEFSDQFLIRGREYASKIRVWLADHNVRQSWILVNSQNLDDYLSQMVGNLQPLLAEAARREKSRRRMWPDDKAKEFRRRVEQALEEVRQITAKTN